MSRYYDCIVVGLGPAGSTVLKDLAVAGVDALGIDKEIFPRNKCCGGAISAAAERQLDVPGWENAIQGEMHTVSVALRFSQALTHSAREPICRFVKRAEFDNVLLQAAVASGANVLCGQPIISVELKPPGVVVHTPAQSIAARCLAGCDGAHSNVARSLGLAPPSGGVALEQEVLLPEKAAKQWAGRAYVSYGEPAWGYGWVFPRKNGVNVGVGSFSPRGAQLPRHLQRLLAHCGLDKHPFRRSGHPIPLGGTPRVLHKGPALLAGDAASLCDPLSGEGISQALLSGHIAARHVVQFLAGDLGNFLAYQTEIEERITSEMALARWIADKLYRAPRLFFNLLKRSPSTLALYFQLIAGKATYQDVMKDIKNQFSRFSLFGA